MGKNKASERARGGSKKKPSFTYLLDKKDSPMVAVTVQETCLTQYRSTSEPVCSSTPFVTIQPTDARHADCHTSLTETEDTDFFRHKHQPLISTDTHYINRALFNTISCKKELIHRYSPQTLDQITQEYDKFISGPRDNDYVASNVEAYRDKTIPSLSEHITCLKINGKVCDYNATSESWIVPKTPGNASGSLSIVVGTFLAAIAAYRFFRPRHNNKQATKVENGISPTKSVGQPQR